MDTADVNVWIVDDDRSIRWVLSQACTQAGMVPREFERADALLDALDDGVPDVIVTDIRMPGTDGLALLARVHAQAPALPVIVMTAHSDLDNAVAAYREGAFDYLAKPFDVDVAIDLIRRAAHVPETDASTAPPPTPGLIGRAPAMQSLFRAIARLSRSSMTVLITGESGTGKELVADALHRTGPRAGGPMLALNTAAIPSELLESELFGHERGAFTGATGQRSGRFEQADGGTLFLDEIGDMPMALQTRLLRVLAEGDFFRVGGTQPLRVDVRVIAATHQNLEQHVANGAFREDLFHRLNVIRLDIPPLRERREDIAPLLERYLREAGDEAGIAPKTLGQGAERALIAYDWPGNVRELVNTCRRLTALAPGPVIRARDLPRSMTGSAGTEPADGWTTTLMQRAGQLLDAGDAPLLETLLPDFERALIRVALARAHGQRQRAAQLLGWGRNTLTRKIRDLGID